jgi:DNA polymerase-3 subunit delta'
VAIIDTADDLNANAANAALKILEEPPQRGVLLLVSNAPGGLLATMRSRCRRLRFTSPDEAAASEWVAAKSGVDLADARRLVKMAKGAPGRAWRLASAGAIEADDAARALLRSLPRLDSSVMMGLADGFRGNGGPGRFEMMLERMADQVAAMASNQAVAGEGAMLDRWAETWETLVALPRDVESVNLDRVDAFYTALWRLRSIA